MTGDGNRETSAGTDSPLQEQLTPHSTKALRVSLCYLMELKKGNDSSSLLSTNYTTDTFTVSFTSFNPCIPHKMAYDLASK